MCFIRRWHERSIVWISDYVEEEGFIPLFVEVLLTILNIWPVTHGC